MPGDDLPDTFSEARRQGKATEYREARRSSKKDRLDTNSFLREDVGPGRMIAAKEVQKPAVFRNLSLRIRGAVGRDIKALVRLERDESGVETKLDLQEGSNSFSPTKLFTELKKGDFLEVKLITEGEDVTPLKEVLTTLTTLHD